MTPRADLREGRPRPRPSVADPASIEQLGSLLSNAAYSEETFAAVLGTRRKGLWLDRKLPLYLRRSPDTTPLGVLIRLFALGVPVDRTRAAAAFAPMRLSQLEEMGIVTRVDGDGAIASLVGITEHKGLLLAHDPWSPTAPEFADSVPGLAPSPLWLDRFTVRREVGRTLDLGAGCGIQALLASRHSRHVTATDINPRAIDFCRFNAVLNGAHAVVGSVGDLFGSVEGQRFDLIVCNPPYIVSPEDGHLYRDGGGDAGFCHRLFRELPGFLADEGFACVVSNWAVAESEEWDDVPRRWVQDGECDALIFLDHRWKPLTYAASMNSDLLGDAAAYEEKLERWTSFYRDVGVREIVGGVVILRKRADADTWVETMDAPPAIGEVSDHLLRIFEGITRCGRAADAALLDVRPSLADGCELRERTVIRSGGSPAVLRTIRPSSGLQFVERLDEQEWAFLQHVDGSRTVREALAASGSASVAPEPAIRLVRILTARGVLALD